jgi:dTDP-4-amino-4,6-dideoxygalactose transaminase
VDVEPDHLTMDPGQLERAITPRTKAIVPVHLYGQPADMDPILDIAHARGIAVVEDACQAHGSDYKGRRCGSMGLVSCFSFYPGKNLGAYGEGGAVTTNDAAVAAKIRSLRAWGKRFATSTSTAGSTTAWTACRAPCSE